MNNHPLFAASIDPSAADPREPFERARNADENGLDLITIMDHPYNARLFDTWTLLTAIGHATRNIHLATNVASLPLRPPALLAKQAATLDILTEGRMELGLGAPPDRTGMGSRATVVPTAARARPIRHSRMRCTSRAACEITPEADLRMKAKSIKCGSFDPGPNRRIKSRFG